MTRSVSHKAQHELAFWESRLQRQTVLTNDHFEYFYTTHFGLDKSFYRGKKVLDIGCGPRGSLEWAAMADVRVGADPLAAHYRRFGTGRHAMRYVACGAEYLPFAGGDVDVVCAFNSLDHVNDLDRAIAEIGRVLAPGGHVLLLTDVHRRPTTMEPMAFDWDVIDRFLPALEVVEQRHIEYTVFSDEGFGDIYGSLRRGIIFDHNDPRDRYGILSANLRKQQQTE